jgi:hypothetical protein
MDGPGQLTDRELAARYEAARLVRWTDDTRALHAELKRRVQRNAAPMLIDGIFYRYDHPDDLIRLPSSRRHRQVRIGR